MAGRHTPRRRPRPKSETLHFGWGDVGTPNTHAIEMATASDRRWFSRNPMATVRYRGAFAGEFDGVPVPPSLPGHRWEMQVEVRQLRPGYRTREPFLVAVADEAAAA